MIIRGFTFEETPKNRRHTLAAWLQYLPFRATVRMVWQPDEPWDDFFERCIWVGQYADVLVTFCDSSLIGAKDKNGTPLMPLAAYQGRAKAVAQLKAHIPGLTAELLNEGGGDWLGPDQEVLEKALAAQAILDQAGVQTAATFYLDGDNPERIFKFAKYAAQVGLLPGWAMVSWYEFSSATPFSPAWGTVFSALGTIFPNAEALCFGEFGPEPKKLSVAERIALIKSIQGIRNVTPRFAGGYFYWRAATETNQVLAALGEP